MKQAQILGHSHVSAILLDAIEELREKLACQKGFSYSAIHFHGTSFEPFHVAMNETIAAIPQTNTIITSTKVLIHIARYAT